MGLLGLFPFFRHPSLDKFCTTCIMASDNLPRLGLESVDSFNCEHGEGFYFVLNTLSRISPFPDKSLCFSRVGLWQMHRFWPRV